MKSPLISFNKSLIRNTLWIYSKLMADRWMAYFLGLLFRNTLLK